MNFSNSFFTQSTAHASDYKKRVFQCFSQKAIPHPMCYVSMTIDNTLSAQI